jgi:hypothetical protein
MNYARVGLSAFGAFLAYFVVGGLTSAIPMFRNEFLKYPAVYRSKEAMMGVMPVGMVATFVAMLVLAVLFAKMHPAGAGWAEGAWFGALIGLFAICAFVLHNYVNLNIGLTLTLFGAAVYLVEWTVAGIAIGLIYRAG